MPVRPVPATVCFIRRGDRILLQRRPTDAIWGGRWNGPGGKVEPGEPPARAIAREVAEETALRIADPTWHGRLELVFGRPERSRLVVQLYTATRFAGRARGSAGLLRWHPADRLPWDLMWPDQRYWLPSVLDGGRVAGECTYDAAGDRLLDWTLSLTAPP